MRIIPVIDLMGGVVVRGVAGRRSEYRPIVSKLTSSAAPLDVARAFRDRFSFNEMYVADLDAIGGAKPAFAIYEQLRSAGFALWLDAGVRNRNQAATLAEAGIEQIVVGLETIDGPALLGQIGQDLGWDRIVFSLDLKAGRPLGDVSGWQGSDAWSFAQQAIGLGVGRLIVLDLARVGVGEGTGTEELCRRLSRTHPRVEIIAGGGIRDQADIDRLAECGVGAVLLASALHDGLIKPSGP